MSTKTTNNAPKKSRTSLASLITRWLDRSAQLSPAIRLKIIEALVIYTTTGIVPKLKPTYQLFLESVIEAPAKAPKKAPSDTDSTTTTTSISYNNNKQNISSSCSCAGGVAGQPGPSGSPEEPGISGKTESPGTLSPIPDRASVSAYLQSKGIQPSEADAQAQAFISFNEARGWQIGNAKVKSAAQWKWLAQRWISGMASHPSPTPAVPSPEEQERRRQEHAREQQTERKRVALNDLWTKVRNNLCTLFTPTEYMETYHAIQPISLTPDGILTIHVPGGPKARALTPDYRPALDDAIRSAFPTLTRLDIS